jgi:hypothetical protein
MCPPTISWTMHATCQMVFTASAPPDKIAFVFAATTEGDVQADGDVRAEGVDAARQWSVCIAVAKNTGSEIDSRGIGVELPRGVGVRVLHVADRGGQVKIAGNKNL